MTRPSYRDSLNRRYILFLFLPRTTRTRRFAAPLVARTPLGTTRTTRTTRTTNASVRSRAALAALTTTHSTDRRRRAEELFDSKKRRTETMTTRTTRTRTCTRRRGRSEAGRESSLLVVPVGGRRPGRKTLRRRDRPGSTLFTPSSKRCSHCGRSCWRTTRVAKRRSARWVNFSTISFDRKSARGSI